MHKVIIILLALLFCQCRKQYTCTCTVYIPQGSNQYTSNEKYSEKMTKKQANAACEQEGKMMLDAFCQNCDSRVECKLK
jgi:hypothetical protein